MKTPIKMPIKMKNKQIICPKRLQKIEINVYRITSNKIKRDKVYNIKRAHKQKGSPDKNPRIAGNFPKPARLLKPTH